MKSQPLHFLGVVVLAAVSMPLVRPLRAEEGHFDRTLQVSGPVELDVRTGSGSISVQGGASSSVHIVGTIHPSGGWFGGDDAEKKVRYLASNPPIEQQGNVIKVGYIEDRELERNISIRYEIVAPVETRLRSSSGSGEQTVSGLKGPVEASAGSGNLSLTNIGDEVRASTGSGHISVEGAKGPVHASTGSGEIRATGVAGGLHASTGSGRVTLRQTAPGEVEVSTGSGTLELAGLHGPVHAQTASGDISVEGEGEDSWRLSTASGSISVHLPSQQGFTLRAHTVSGSIHTAREMTVQGTLNRHELEGKVGDGGLLLDVSTVSGNIRVE